MWMDNLGKLLKKGYKENWLYLAASDLLSSFRTEALNKLMGGRRQTGLFSGRDF
jgi:hypothetical protein